MKTRILTPPKRRPLEPNIGLINVVFLLILFFLIAGRIAPSLSKNVELIEISMGETTLPEGAIGIDASGIIFDQSGTLNLEDIAQRPNKSKLQLAADQSLSAQDFASLLFALEAQGWEEIAIIGARAP